MANEMTAKEAIEAMLSIAAMWAENAQDGLPFTITADTTDEQIAALGDDYDSDQASSVRDFERAAKTLNRMLAQRGIESPDARPDGHLTTLIDTIVYG